MGDICDLLLRFAAGKEGVVEAEDWEGVTPAHLAAKEGHADVCRLLVSRGAKLNAALDFGVTTFQIVAERGHCEVLALLIAEFTQVGDTAASDSHDALMETALAKRTVDGRNAWLAAAASGNGGCCQRLFEAVGNFDAA